MVKLGTWGTGARSPSNSERGSCAPGHGRSRTSPTSSACRNRACPCGCATSTSSRRPRNRGHRSHNPHPFHLAKLAEIERCHVEGARRVGALSEREFFVLGAALYAGEGSKTQDQLVRQQRSELITSSWRGSTILRRRERTGGSALPPRGARSHAAIDFWSEVTGISTSQFYKPYRAVADPTRRRTKHVMGCAGVTYLSTSTFRRVMGVVAAVSSKEVIPG